MGEPKSFDAISVNQFRNLEEAPLDAAGENDIGDDELEVVAPTGEALEPNTFDEQGNKFGGQTSSGDLSGERGLSPDIEAGARSGFTEILESDLEAEMGDDGIHSPETADMNAPGEIDIEELDESALDATDLPQDARLDPIEE